LNRLPHEIQLTVWGNGIGFDAEKELKGGLGLASMKEHLKLVKGDLSIDSQSGRGTVIQAQVPLYATKGAAPQARIDEFE
jgi:signal transduction histidine kinase